MNNIKNYKLLKEIINKVDPLGLIDPDTPESFNEYESELKELISLSLDYSDEKAIYKNLKNIFSSYFEGVKINQDSLRELARKIVNP